MNKIALHENEAWFLRFLRKLSPAAPPAKFIRMARVRLLARVAVVKQPMFGWLITAKRVLASVLVMLLAVTSTLLFTGSKHPVSAADNTYIQVLSGSVKIKHSDKLAWNVITQHTELVAGDLIQLSDSASAVIHFFDDTRLHLSDNSLLLLSRLDISPGFDKQGIIETSLHKGRAWVQTLNVDDDYAKFTLVTPDAIVSTVNASFDVQTSLLDPTTIRVFKHNVNVQALIKDTRAVVTNGKLNSLQKISLDSSRINRPADKLANVAPIVELADEDRNEKWVTNNLQSDKTHLAQLRERELVNLRAATGSLPGEMFYPLKRAKERLSLVFSFNEASQSNAQIDIANQRLNESIVLIGNGEKEKGEASLVEYQNLVKQIAKDSQNKAVAKRLTKRVVAVHQKTLIAALPSDNKIGIVKQVLDETEELLEKDPIKKAKIRLNNAIEDVVTIQDYVIAGNLNAAQGKLEDHKILASDLIKEVTQFKDDEEKKKFYENILEAQHEERRILAEITKNLSGQSPSHELTSLLKEKDKNLDIGIKLAAAVVSPVITDVALKKAVMLPVDEKVHEFVNKVHIYKTPQGQRNQISRLFDKYPQYKTDMVFLNKLSGKIDSQVRDVINLQMLKVKRKQAAYKGREVRKRIDRSRSLYAD